MKKLLFIKLKLYRHPSLYAGVTYREGTADNKTAYNATLLLMGNGGLGTVELKTEPKAEIKSIFETKNVFFIVYYEYKNFKNNIESKKISIFSNKKIR